MRYFNENLGGFCWGHKTGDLRSNLELRKHINVPKLKVAKFAIMTFTKMFPDVKVVHLKMDNMVALSYIKKSGGTHNKVHSEI